MEVSDEPSVCEREPEDGGKVVCSSRDREVPVVEGGGVWGRLGGVYSK